MPDNARAKLPSLRVQSYRPKKNCLDKKGNILENGQKFLKLELSRREFSDACNFRRIYCRNSQYFSFFFQVSKKKDTGHCCMKDLEIIFH